VSSAAETPDAPRRLARAEAVLRARTRRFCVVIEDTYDPHNTSAVLRTCEAFGIQDVHLVAEAKAQATLNPKVSIGAHRWLTLHRHRGADAAIAALRAGGYALYVSHIDAEATPLPAIQPEGRAAYVFGNERAGVSRAWLAAADARFWIPTTGFTGSLNLSVAVAITVYDRLFGQRHATAPAGDLSGEERAALRHAWFTALAGGDPVRQREWAAHGERGVEPRSSPGGDRRLPRAQRADGHA
jgi:tRNA (guanosine-2'-O-)-methyltransferase